MVAAIRCVQISKSFHYYPVLKEISFELAEGECFALLGPNGAGKTTLLRILATLQRPSGGYFQILGHDGIQARDQIRRLVLLLGHGSYLYDELTALENIRFAVSLYGINPSLRELKIALDRVGIGAFADLKTRHFSMGMKKRLSIAKALLIRPRILLLDEPYASLDEDGMRIINQYVREVTDEGGTVFFTTHNRPKSAEVAHRAGILERGHLQEFAVKQLAVQDEQG